ncbi:MAG: penicillin-insensitive murein endopeptidase [Sandaracinus sp.]
MRSPRTLALFFAAFLAVLGALVPGVSSQAREPVVATATQARPRRARAQRQRAPRRPNSASIGYAFHGRLRRGVLLDESRLVRHAGEYRSGGNFYGTTELVGLLERAAAQVARRLPGARLSVGELSRQNGGAIAGHRSHQNGRDVDIAFYMLDGAGHPYDPYGFAAFDRNGHGLAPNESLTFDDARNWELVARLVADADARVQYIFVADTLKNRLLRTGRRRRAPARVLARAEAVMVQPTHGHPHRNHFHVRIYCPPGDRPACEDREPFHPWYPGTPPTRTNDDDAAAAGD